MLEKCKDPCTAKIAYNKYLKLTDENFYENYISITDHSFTLPEENNIDPELLKLAD